MCKDLTKGVVPVEGGLGELSVTADELRFASAGGAFVVARSQIDELQWIHGLVVVGSDAFLLDPDDQLELLAAFDASWGAQDLTVLSYPPDDLLDELAALDDEAVAAATSAPAPSAAQRIDRAPPPGEEPAAVAKDEKQPQEEKGPGVGAAVAEAASSPVVEEVAATVGKMLGVNKGTTRSLFRAFRKGRR